MVDYYILISWKEYYHLTFFFCYSYIPLCALSTFTYLNSGN